MVMSLQKLLYRYLLRFVFLCSDLSKASQVVVAGNFSVANSFLVDGFGLLVGALFAQKDFSAVIIILTAEQLSRDSRLSLSENILIFLSN